MNDRRSGVERRLPGQRRLRPDRRDGEETALAPDPERRHDQRRAGPGDRRVTVDRRQS